MFHFLKAKQNPFIPDNVFLSKLHTIGITKDEQINDKKGIT